MTLSVKNAITAASQFGSEEIHVLLPGSSADQLAQDAASIGKIQGVTKVLTAEDAALSDPIAQDLAEVCKKVIDSGDYNRVICSTSTSGKDLLPRLGGFYDSQPITDIINIISDDTFQRPVYAGNAISTMKSSDKVKFMTVRPTNFDPAQEDGSDCAIETVDTSGCVGTVG